MPKTFGTSASGGGGAAIGEAITDATEGSVLFAGAGGVLAQDNAGFFYNDATNQLRLTAGAATNIPLLIKGAASQSGNYAEVRNSADGLVGSIQPYGSAAITLSLGGTGGRVSRGDIAFGDILEDGHTTLGYNAASSVKFRDNGGAITFQVDSNATAGNTRLLIWDVDNNQIERVSVGANDSGGAGFKLLRIAN